MFKTAIPPVCIWGTLLDSKLFIARNKIHSNVSYGTHVVTKAMEDTMKATKERLSKKKEEKEKQAELKKSQETVSKVVEEKNTSEVKPEVNIKETTVIVGPDFTQLQEMNVEETSYGPDFTGCETGVIYDVDPLAPMPQSIIDVEVEESESATSNNQQSQHVELHEVTPEDIEHILKNMQGGAKL